MREPLSKITLVFADPRSLSREIIGVNTRDVVEAERVFALDFLRNYGPYYRAASEVLRAAKSPAIRNVVVALIERLNCDVFLSFIKDNTYTAEVSEKSLRGWYPISSSHLLYKRL